MIKSYLFDFDGTLVDSMPTYEKMILRLLDREKIQYDNNIINIITPLGTVATAHYLVGLGVKMTVEEILELMRQELIYEYEHNIPTKSNVAQTVKKLKNEGASLSVLTASPHVSLDPCLKNNGIYEHFDNIWSCDDDFGITKTNPQIYIKTSEIIGACPKDILFVDDNLDALKTAKAAGMTTCGIYDLSSDGYTQQIKEAADFYVYDFKELLELPLD